MKEDTYNEFSHRTLSVKSEKYGELEVEQLHYTEWPDHGCPQGEKQVLQLIEQMNSLRVPESPILLHCSAGCGRTGTVIALNIIRELINQKVGPGKLSRLTVNFQKITEINVQQLVLDLRRQRTSMVQTQVNSPLEIQNIRPFQTQYHLLHKCVAVYCKMALGIDTETKSPGSSPESVKSLPPSQPSPDVPKTLPLISPKPTNPFSPTEKPTLTINTSNGSNNETTKSTNPFLEDVANDELVCPSTSST